MSSLRNFQFFPFFVFLMFRFFRRRVWIRQGTSGKEFLLIAGFNEPVEMWEWTVQGVIRAEDTVVIIERRFTESGKPWRWFIGWTPLWFQRWEARMIFQQLRFAGKIHHGVTFIGHSVGGLIAGDLALAFPQEVGDVHIIAFPDKWGSLLHPAFWKNLGVRGFLYALIGSIFPFIGVRVPVSTVRGLFTGKINASTAMSFRRILIPDSPLVFYALVFWYGLIGRPRLARAKKNGWQGQATHYICPGDTVFLAEDIEWTCGEVGGFLVRLADNTPHCFWFVEGVGQGQNSRAFKSAIYQEKATLVLGPSKQPRQCAGERVSGEI